MPLSQPSRKLLSFLEGKKRHDAALSADAEALALPIQPRDIREAWKNGEDVRKRHPSNQGADAVLTLLEGGEASNIGHQV